MNSDKMDYKFCADFLRYAYHVMGYETALKELHYIHHLYSSSPVHPVPPPNQTIPEPIVLSVVNEPSSETPATTKNIIINDNNATKIKYNRSQLSDDIRCTTIISNGSKCSFKRADNSEFCSRHNTQLT